MVAAEKALWAPNPELGLSMEDTTMDAEPEKHGGMLTDHMGIGITPDDLSCCTRKTKIRTKKWPVKVHMDCLFRLTTTRQSCWRISE